MNNYSNPMVTYNEIIEALKAILDCSKTNGYLDEYSFLNASYDALNKSPLYEEQEQALIQAIQSLEKTLDAADKVIRENLKDVLNEIVTSNSFIFPTRYKQDEEYRKLAAQDEFVAKLKEMSLPLEVLSIEVDQVPEEKESLDEIESLVNPFEEVEIEPLDVPATEDEPEEDLYYSKAKLGNVKNAFAVTEEQYNKLKQYKLEDLKELDLEVPEKEETPLVEPEKEEIVEAAVEQSDLTVQNISEESSLAMDYIPKEEPIVVEENDEITISEPGKEEVLEETIEQPAESSETEQSTESEEEEQPSENKENSVSSEQKKALDRIKLIKKALEKAKEKENAQLVQILEQQLKKELESLKS